MTVIDELKKYDELYYSGEAAIPDSTYDELRSQAKEDFPNDPYWSLVGSPANPSHLSEVNLTIHMGSQQKLPLDEVQGVWYNLANINGEVLLMEKLDGSSVEVVYEGGELKRVATRGDGIKGFDITNNALKWSDLPRTISYRGKLVVRGEAILPISSWAANFQSTANPRNAGNGTITRKEDPEGLNQFISFKAFDCDAEPEEDIGDRIDSRLLFLHDFGINTVVCMVCNSASDIRRAYSTYERNRGFLAHEIDGLVLSTPNRSRLLELGYKDSGTRPRGQVAVKFPPASGITTVKAINLTIGQTGAIIPTAELEPVKIGGVTVSNVLLNNQDFIADLGVGIGDSVMIERAGDVIPYMAKVVNKAADGYYKFPDNCPFCSKLLVKKGRATCCVNDGCDGKSFQVIKNWVKKLEIKFLGDNTLQALYDNGMVKSIPDLYDLSAQSIAVVQIGNGCLGESLAAKIVAEIDATREIPLDLFMGSLSITFLGRSMANHIGYESVDEYLNATHSDLSTRDNMGVNKASIMLESINVRRELIGSVLGKVTIKQKQKPIEGTLSGLSFVFTGVRMKSEEKAKLYSLGGIESPRVSKGITYLVQKDASSESSKSQKAKTLGIEVISYDAFRKMLE